MGEYKNKVNAVVMGAIGLVLGLVLLRFLVTLMGLAPESFFTQLIIGITDPLVVPFNNIFRLSQIGSVVFDLAALVSFFVLLILGVLVHNFVLDIFLEDGRKIAFGLVNTLFKLIEFLFIARIILKLFGVIAVSGTFSNSVYSLTAWASAIFPDISLFNGVIEISTIIFLILIIGLDVFTERIVTSGIMTQIADRLIQVIDWIKLKLPVRSVETSPVSKSDAVNNELAAAPATTAPAPAEPTISQPQTTNAFSNAALEVEDIQNVHQDK